MIVFSFFITCKRTNNANNATHYVKLGKKRREGSRRNYYIISLRVIIKAIIIIGVGASTIRLVYGLNFTAWLRSAPFFRGPFRLGVNVFDINLILSTPPPPGGVFFWGDSKLRTRRKRTPAEENPKFLKDLGFCSGGVLFLRVPVWKPHNKETPPRGGGVLGGGVSYDQTDVTKFSTPSCQ